MTTPNTLAKLAAELAQLASEGPALIHTQSGAYISQKLSEAAKALAAQALPAAEPVAWAVAGEVTNWARDFSKYRTQHYVRPVYTAPQATQQAAQAHCGKCDECGKDQADGWALYCVDCLEKTGLLAKEALPNAQHVSSTAADLTDPNDTAAQATTGAAATGGGVTTGAPSEPFGYFKAQPFGWTDCAETDDGAVALYEGPQQAALATAGWVLVPVEPTEDQWGGLARDILMAFDMGSKTPAKLLDHLEKVGREIPQWLRDEGEMKDVDHVISKGTRAVIIYRAMLAALPQPPQPQEDAP